MKTFSERIYELEREVSDTYKELKKDREFVLLSEEDIAEGDYGDYFEVRNHNNGNVYDVQIVRIDSKGIEIIEAEDDSERYYIGFHDLSSIEDRINLVENMQNYYE
jgi:hypothetical protein